MIGKEDQDKLEALAEWLFTNAGDVTYARIELELDPLGRVEQSFGVNPRQRKKKRTRNTTLWTCAECGAGPTTGGPLAIHQKAAGHTGRNEA